MHYLCSENKGADQLSFISEYLSFECTVKDVNFIPSYFNPVNPSKRR